MILSIRRAWRNCPIQPRFAVLAGDSNERHDAYAVLAAADLAAERSPGVVREHVLTRPDVRFRDALRNESVKDRGPIGQRLSADGARQRFLLQLLTVAAKRFIGPNG